MIWFNFYSRDIYICDVTKINQDTQTQNQIAVDSDAEEKNSRIEIEEESKWDKYDIKLPYRSKHRWCLVPCYENDYVFIFYFEVDNNEIWMLDLLTERLEKSEKYLNMQNINIEALSNEDISMVQAGEFIHIFEFDRSEIRQFKINIMEIMPKRVIQHTFVATHGYIREYNEMTNEYTMKVPRDIVELILKFVCIYL